MAMTVLTVVGGGWGALLLLPMIWHARTRSFAGALAGAIVIEAVIVWATKAAVGRVRPWIALGLSPPVGSPHDFSFPSGHSAGVFCLFAFLAVVLPVEWRQAPRRARLVTAAALVYAVLVAASRVYLGAHFPTDVIIGAAIGAGVGYAAGALHVRRRPAAG